MFNVFLENEYLENHKSDHDDAFGEILQQRDGQNNGKAGRQRPRALSICGWIVSVHLCRYWTGLTHHLRT